MKISEDQFERLMIDARTLQLLHGYSVEDSVALVLELFMDQESKRPITVNEWTNGKGLPE